MAYRLSQRGIAVTVVEKETSWAAHQTGHNSGVIHAGPYYRPGSLKATMCTAGNASMVAFAKEHGIRHDVCGKLIVATDEKQLPVLRTLYERGQANGTPCTMTSDIMINCAGLQSDRVARLAGIEPSVRIVPFRGEYYELAEKRRYLVNALIYPVPDPDLPFLGVHFTRMIDGSVHAGPNAVFAFAREGYRWRDISPRDMWDSISYSGFLKMASRNLGNGAHEMARSWSRRLFAASLAQLVPAVRREDIVPSGSGVRAQAIRPDGSLADDFIIQYAPRQVHVLNAPSPAATASLEIAAA
ncbi:MAG TPA: FAD-dependent oxidoreductase, partial [Propionibacteriaceae bacterium]